MENTIDTSVDRIINVKAFTLKKHEITMAAKAEVEKLQDRLLFVSMKDYNTVLEENKRLRKMLEEKHIKIEEAQTAEAIKVESMYLSRQRASAELCLSGRKIEKYASLGAIKTRKSNGYTYYYKPDLEKYSELLKVRGTVKKVLL